jgi:hypothetical protein
MSSLGQPKIEDNVTFVKAFLPHVVIRLSISRNASSPTHAKNHFKQIKNY